MFLFVEVWIFDKTFFEFMEQEIYVWEERGTKNPVNGLMFRMAALR